MKINDYKSYGLYKNVKTNTLSKKSSGKGVGASGIASHDSIEFTHVADSSGKEYRGLKTQLSSDIMKSASADRIEELKNAIANGTYFVDSSDIADSMLSYLG